MDQEKIGSFISICRKEQGMTQALLAEKLGITDRAISIWETGKSMPDASIMLELCELLNINVNELFSGERLDMDQYKNMAEENLMELRRQEELNNKKLLSLENVIALMGTGSFLIMVFAASFALTSFWWRLGLILGGLIIFLIGMAYSLKLEHDAGYYECPECGVKYLPSMKAVIFAPHIGRNRKMKCPHCGKRAYHKKVLTK